MGFLCVFVAKKIEILFFNFFYDFHIRDVMNEFVYIQ